MRQTEEQIVPNWSGIAYGLSLSTLAAYHQFKMAPVLSEMAQIFEYSPLMSGSFMSIYAVAGFFLAKWMGDHMHDKEATSFIRNILTLTLIGAGVGLLFPENAMSMFIARSLEGIGACGLSIAGPAVIFRFSRPDQQGLAASIGALWIPIGVVIASFLALWPDEYLGRFTHQWQINWLVSIGASFVLILITARYQQQQISPTSRPKTVLNDAEKTPSLWESPAHRKAIIFTALTFTFWACQNIAFMSWLPSYLSEDLGYQQHEAALIFIAPMVFLGIFNLLAVPLMKLFGVTKLLSFAILGQGLSVFLILYVFNTDTLLLQFICLLLYGALAGVTPSCLYRMPSLVLGKEAGTKAFGWIMSARNIGVFSGPLIIAAALQFSEAKWAAFGVTIIISCLLSVLMSLFLMKKVKALT